MLEYPSISPEPRYGGPYFIWDKLDGINLRSEWSKQQGFYKLGARATHLSDQWRGEAGALIDFQAAAMIKIFKKQRWDRATVFFEFYGERSFAGIFPRNSAKLIALFDVAGPDRKLLDPRDFYKLFYDIVQTPKLLLRGNFNKEVEAEVRAGTLPGMTFEGIVAKGPAVEKDGPPIMFKSKSQAWIDKVHGLYGDKAKDYL